MPQDRAFFQNGGAVILCADVFLVIDLILTAVVIWLIGGAIKATTWRTSDPPLWLP
jgi:hypothetical protein